MNKLGILIISPVCEAFVDDARDLILEGFKERFGFIDYSLNPDLTDIMTTYKQPGTTFLTGIIDGTLIATGAIAYEEAGVGRIVRMSVEKNYRRRGIAKRMLDRLEAKALEMGYQQLVLETHEGWQSAVGFYSANGYKIERYEGERAHFRKQLG
ncbi:GNAT family N-acetyltransferase [Thalassobacillus hwangdonensis]|uniref:GNAT family N-acetyltransferase n=1 Tax=Thalassobacillus hwangdonensis TaxID=546108 RepID=A0ABW3L481_9BACI